MKEFKDEGYLCTGTAWTFVCPCGREHGYKRPVIAVDLVNQARRERDSMADLIREVSDEVVLLPVATLNAIAERAEKAERELAEMKGRK